MKKTKNNFDSKNIIIIEEQDSDSIQDTEEIEDRKAIFYQHERKILLIMVVFNLVLLAAAYLFMLNVRLTEITPAWIIRNASSRMAELIRMLSGRPLQSGMNFFLYREIMVMLAGAALAAAGTVYQAVFRNPLASPTILGIQSGGGLGAALYLVLFVSPAAPTITYGSQIEQKSFFESIIQGNAMQYFVILFCFLSLLVVLLLSRSVSRGSLSPISMILCGTVFSSLCATLIEMVQNYFAVKDPYSTRTDALGTVMTGTFEQVNSFAHLIGMAVPILLCLTLLILSGEKLNILTISRNEAVTSGVSVAAYRLFYLILATALTAVVVAFCGIFTFIGLVAPFLCRRLIGVNNRYLIPASALAGASLTMIAYWFAYAVGYTALINISLSIIGGAIFAVMIFRGRGEKYE